MIDLYYWNTPNGHKVTILLEEVGLEYRIKPVNFLIGEQHEPEFLKISPNNKIPAIVDHEPTGGGAPISIFESCTILQYLAEKVGRFLPTEVRGRAKTLQWLIWQAAGFGPMLAQNHYFALFAPIKIPHAIERYIGETARLYGVLDRQLTGREFITGEYSIADMACYPWVVHHEEQGQDLNDFPAVKQWFERLQTRPALVRAYEKGDQACAGAQQPTEEQKAKLFGYRLPQDK